MVYKNTRTGMVIQTTGKVTGKDWKPVEEKKPAPPKSDPSDKKPAKAAEK